MLRDPVLRASLAMSPLVSTVMMATLVVGPFYLSGALGLDAALVGIVMSVGPLVAALTGVPAGRLADRFGARRMTLVGLVGMAAGCFLLSMMPATLGIPGYIAPIVVITAGYALFQTANNTAVMTDVRPDQRGVISGMLNLARNLGLITGASVMGAVFALASATRYHDGASRRRRRRHADHVRGCGAPGRRCARHHGLVEPNGQNSLKAAQARVAVAPANRPRRVSRSSFRPGKSFRLHAAEVFIPLLFDTLHVVIELPLFLLPLALLFRPQPALFARLGLARPLPRGRAHWRARSRCRSAER